ncbi:juvenile hormone epoxide hydrolase 1-like [Frieseomelitta varia]|uniref:juvenile hormone epoxide hydrolase 1-like n=1 Tax=Frieseomelitta varia TaxID=561572 RepID=UPI001CB6A61A|nr:juvenile hormone epoxide hydrolase 1-like [Frieseomelitta varia]XP_043510383.1 juvenile hormone epoxide hydrolase 1-like [Frieseomelitta varia]
MLKTAALIVLFSSGLIVLFFSSKELKVPTLPETNWGSKKSGKESTEIRPFKIDVPAKILDDLKYRLAHRRTYAAPLEGVAWTYGISTKYLNTVLDYWRDNYNWSERQALLNKYPQFITNIQGLDIHFYHIKPTNLPKDKNLKVLPLLLLHGWPGSVVEFQKIIPMLTKPSPNQNFVFEVIVPSLPGYGFSEGAVRPGMATAQIAVIFKNLMHRLGFEKFYIQGGDWGAAITANMAALFPEKIIGLHSNMCATLTGSTFLWTFIGTYFPSLVGVNEHYSRYFPLSRVFFNLIEESGYFHIQASKPDTIGTAVSASPDALAAYILEKFSTWTNTAYKERDDGGLTEKFTLDELLDNVMIYWVSNSITTSVRLYAESFNSAYRASKIEELPINVPTGCAVFPNELISHPESLLKSRFTKLIQYNLMSRGGHFAAFEEPKLLADDIFSFVKKTEELSTAKAA